MSDADSETPDSNDEGELQTFRDQLASLRPGRRFWRDVMVQFVGTVMAAAFIYLWAVGLGYLRQPNTLQTVGVVLGTVLFVGVAWLTRLYKLVPASFSPRIPTGTLKIFVFSLSLFVIITVLRLCILVSIIVLKALSNL